MWTQIVGKTRMILTPRVNHWWNVPLYVSARGLTTSLMHSGGRGLETDRTGRASLRFPDAVGVFTP